MDSIEQSAMTNEQPEQWVVKLARDWNYECKRCSEYEGDFAADFAADLQRAITERTADLVADNAKLREVAKQARCILPYLFWTIGPESPGHHPTMPSAVAGLRQALAQQDKPDAK